MKELTNATDRPVEPPARPRNSPATKVPRSDRCLSAGADDEQASKPGQSAESRQVGASPPDPELERLTSIYRRWQRTPTHPRQTFLWKEPELTVCGQLGYLIGFALSILLIPLSHAVLVLAFHRPIQAPIAVLPLRPRLLIALTLLWLVNAWMIDRYLRSRTTEESGFKPWLLKLRFLIGGVPLLGHYVIPGWRWILRKKPGWVTRKSAQLPPWPEFLLPQPSTDVRWPADRFSGLRGLADEAGRRLNSESGLFFIMLGNIVFLGSWIWSSTATQPTFEQILVVCGCAGILHIAAFAGMFCYLLDETRRAKGNRFLQCLILSHSAFFLFPVPYLALMVFIFLILYHEIMGISTQRETLIHKIYSKPKSGMRLVSWLRFEKLLRNEWRRISGWRRFREPTVISPPPLELTAVSQRLLSLFQVKSFALAIDGMALAWLAMWLGDRQLDWGQSIESSLNAVGYGCLVLAGMGGLVMVIYFLHIGLRSLGRFAILDYHPYAQCLMASQFSLLVGLSIGIDLYQSDIASIATTLQFAGGCVLITGGLGFMMRMILPRGERVEKPSSRKVSFLIFSLFLILGGDLTKGGEASEEPMITLIKTLTITCPLLSIGLGRRFLSWLLWPFVPRDMLSSQLPARLRWTLMFLIATMMLPLGGLAVPLWIYVRHRKWPAWEKWSSRGPSSPARA